MAVLLARQLRGLVEMKMPMGIADERNLSGKLMGLPRLAGAIHQDGRHTSHSLSRFQPFEDDLKGLHRPKIGSDPPLIVALPS